MTFLSRDIVTVVPRSGEAATAALGVVARAGAL